MMITNGVQPFCYAQNSEAIRIIAESLLDDDKWQKEWVDNSAKNAPPPDYYNDNQKLMLEVMRVDDHAFEQNGRIFNPTNQKARKSEKEIKEKFEDSLTELTQIFVNTPTDLPSFEDHNYGFYKNNFKRIVEKHIEKIDLYRSNHPGYKLIFFVFDESSMYCQVDEPHKTIKQGERFDAEPHFWFYDKVFLDVFKESGIDYLIWYTPYKQLELFVPPLNLPYAIVFDCNHMDEESIEYPEAYMTSTEE